MLTASIAGCSSGTAHEGSGSSRSSATRAARAHSASPHAKPSRPGTPSPGGGDSGSAAGGSGPPVHRFTIAATGDLLAHSPVYERALADGGDHYDFGPMFDKVRPILSRADLAVCHLETPLSVNDQNLSSYPVFNVPHELADAIRGAGYDYCSTASNHSYDQGPAGVKATIKVLNAAGIRHDGSARSAHEAHRPQLIDVNGVKVGMISYAYGLNGFQLPAGKPWLVNVIDSRSILRDARAARAAGADFVILSLHWGLEYQVTPDAQQLALGPKLLKSPAIDLILGHHAHVVQPIERVGKEYLVYGMGNFLSNQSIACCPPETQDGVIVRLQVEGRRGHWRFPRVTYTPTWVDIGPYVITPVARALHNPALAPAKRTALRQSWARTTHAIGLLSARKAGVRPAGKP